MSLVRAACAAVVATLFVALQAPHAAAVIGGGGPTLGIIDIAGLVYIDDQGFVAGNGLWIYEETNGEPGLQRGGCSFIVPDDCYYPDGNDGPDAMLI